MGHHGHDHALTHHHSGTPIRALAAALGVTAVVFVAELVGGMLSGSLALLADAMHMLSDATGLIIAVVAVLIGTKAASPRATYGYRGAEVVAAAVNAVAVAAVCVWIVVEALLRLGGPSDIDTGTMAGVALVGLTANSLSAWILSRHRAGSLNVEGAYLHVLSDLLGSVAVLVAAAVIHFTGWAAADTVASLAIAGLVLPRAVRLLASSVGVLLDRVPEGYDVVDIRAALAALDEVEAVHDLHVWSTNGTDALATCHLVVQHSGCTGSVLDAAQQRLREFGIEHSTIQIEHPEHRGHEHVC